MQNLDTLEHLASRIERAYRRRRPVRPTVADDSVWLTAAAALVKLHRRDASVPIDPELYVVAQTMGAGPADPHRELTDSMSTRRYLRRVRQIVRRLRAELVAELNAVEERLRLGEALGVALRSGNRRISHLGRYLAALRHGRPELAKRFRAAARRQHEACPLYRQACALLIDPEDYPVADILPELRRVGVGPLRVAQPDLN